jgi:hypothetical protein
VSSCRLSSDGRAIDWQGGTSHDLQHLGLANPQLFTIVFGENDPARRRAAVDEIFTEDCVFYDPSGGVYRSRDENRSRRGRDQGDSP